MNEFNLIEEYFNWDEAPGDVVVAVGDDAAVLKIRQHQQLVTSIDTLISGVHFPYSTSAHAIGHKALAVNLSDLAAMGAKPKWFTLALTLPEINKSWLQDFSAGLKGIAQEHSCFLVGGDTTRGPLSISIQVMGLVDKGQSLLRNGAKAGDKIYVSGTLGDAAAGLASIQNDLALSVEGCKFCHQRLNYPTPRLVESEIIKDFASSCIDVSDGLLQDLSHILKASQLGAELDLSSIPLSSCLEKLNKEQAIAFALSGGDDYELLFTIPEENEGEFLKQISNVTCVGHIHDKKQLIMDENGRKLAAEGYNHFNVR